jgi:hypothetical protein
LDSTLTTLAAIDMPLGLVAVVLIAVAVTVQLRARRSMRWFSTTGQISSATVDERVENGTKTFYCPMIAYEYDVDGHHYMQNRLMMGSPFRSSNRNAAQRWVDRYAEGSTVTVYYNPDNPSEAVLVRKASGPVMVFWGIAIVLVVVAVAASLWVERGAH